MVRKGKLLRHFFATKNEVVRGERLGICPLVFDVRKVLTRFEYPLTLTSISLTAKAAASGAVRLSWHGARGAEGGRTRASASAAPAPLLLPSSNFSVRPHSRLEHNPGKKGRLRLFF
ncbi:hypothetical protein B5X24_HaOG207875 [Helicoverpa armigera]|uniref:Uncharacterized protein n=1 Tax=Helicoverpa armigera TaxID=29058 RepID=A0A2W1BRQ2_HELAM|nr:hypothetical protein B5X24_HaOG207875 [Helicoverpa armigera]